VDGYTAIEYGVRDRVATITPNRPAARNGFTKTMADELRSALEVADGEDEARTVVLTGAGADFRVGADLSGGGFAAAPGAASAGPPTSDRAEPAAPSFPGMASNDLPPFLPWS
jgi:enoyl-CoA hydratase/carnithine racemase